MIREYLDVDTCHTLVLGLVMSHLHVDYANSLYQGLPEVTLRKLQMLQNMAAKLVLNCHSLSSATEARKVLHWLPIKYRVQYKILILVHKCIKGEAPTYLIDLIKEQPISRQGLPSASRLHHLQIPATKHTIFADHSFSVSGPRLWNSLPDSIKTLNDTNIF